MTIPQSAFFFLRHFTPGCQWPYPSLIDRFFFNPVYETVVWSLTFRVENMFEKKNGKNQVCETVVWSLADWVKNLIENQWPGLSDSDMVTGGLSEKRKAKVEKIIEKLKAKSKIFNSENCKWKAKAKVSWFCFPTL